MPQRLCTLRHRAELNGWRAHQKAVANHPELLNTLLQLTQVHALHMIVSLRSTVFTVWFLSCIIY